MPPGPPKNVKTSKIGQDFVVLEWKAPVEDGGSKITNYKIEKCDDKSDDWVKVEEVKAYDLTYKVEKLKDNVGYYFAVSAKNEAGYGEAEETDKAAKPKKAESEYCVVKRVLT